jgi:hypothetical protein
VSGHDNIAVHPPIEALLDPDPELWLVWAPLAETGVAMECGACEDVCSCEEQEDEEDQS